MALPPEAIIAGVNREVEFLTASLATEKEEKEALQNKLNAAQQELTEGRWDADAVHRHNQRLQAEASMLQNQVMELQKESYNASLQAELAWREVADREQYISGLHGHIAYIRDHSAGGRAVSHAAFQNMESFFQTQLDSASAESRKLQDNLANLRRFVDKKTSGEKSKQDALIKQLITARANLLVAEQRQNTLEQKLVASGKEIKAIQETSSMLVKARDSLNKLLLDDLDKKKAQASTSAKHRKIQAKANKVAKETTQAMAATEQLMRNEIARLEKKIKGQEKEMLAEKMHHKTLQGHISSEQKRQKDFQKALDTAERDASDHKRLSETLKHRVQAMKTDCSGLTQDIRNLEVTIQRLVDRGKKLEAEADKQGGIAAQHQEELDEQKTMNEL